MLSRITLVLLTLFWVTMNYLLWRSEFAGRNHPGSAVPVEVVWRKILTATDPSGLGILHHDRQIGHGQWSPNFGQDYATKRILADELPPEGMMQRPASYQIDFTGNATLNDLPGRLNYHFDIKLTTNQDWQEFTLSLKLPPSSCEIHARAAEQAVHFKLEDENGKTERVLKFADLQNPQALLQQLSLPVPLEILGALGVSPQTQNQPAPSLGLVWEARNDWATIGHTPVRAYRLQTTLLDRYRIVIIVSRVGEILRVELPDEWLLVNETIN